MGGEITGFDPIPGELKKAMLRTTGVPSLSRLRFITIVSARLYRSGRLGYRGRRRHAPAVFGADTA
jgi:hypothetical protein